MGILNELGFMGNHKQASAVTATDSNGSGSLPLAVRSSVKIAGAFLLVILAAILTLSLRGGHAQSALKSEEPANQSASQDKAAAAPDVQSETSSNVSSSVNTSNNGGTPQVTVNGKNVPVPKNGTTQQTIDNGNGQTTTVNVSNNQSNNGSSFSSNFSQVSNSSTSVTQEVNSQ